jgi:hypothetical protein
MGFEGLNFYEESLNRLFIHLLKKSFSDTEYPNKHIRDVHKVEVRSLNTRKFVKSVLIDSILALHKNEDNPVQVNKVRMLSRRASASFF